MVNEFIDWLNGELAAREWSQAELARRAGLSQAAVSLVLSGQRRPGLDFLDGVAIAFRVPAEQVLKAAGVIDATQSQESPPGLIEIIEIWKSSTEEERGEMLEHARWRAERAREERERAKRRRPGTAEA